MCCPTAACALYTFHLEGGHGDPSEPACQTFSQETLFASNVSNFPNGSSVSLLFTCLFCTNFSCTPTFEPWSDFKKETKWVSCGHKAVVWGFQMLCQLTREVCTFFFFFFNSLHLLQDHKFGLLGIFSKPQDTAVKISPSIHPAWLVLVVMNEKENLSVLLLCPCECCTLHAAGYLSFCCLVHYCSIESKAGCLSVTAAHKGQLSCWHLSANSCRT